MAKSKKTYRSLPKRIAGVKVPKALRRAADTELGAALIAEIVVAAGFKTLESQKVREAMADLRSAGAKTLLALTHAIQNAAPSRMEDAADESERRARRLGEAFTH